MARVYAGEIGEHIGERVQLSGWVHSVRLLGKVNFLVLRDASAEGVRLTPRTLVANVEQCQVCFQVQTGDKVVAFLGSVAQIP